MLGISAVFKFRGPRTVVHVHGREATLSLWKLSHTGGQLTFLEKKEAKDEKRTWKRRRLLWNQLRPRWNHVLKRLANNAANTRSRPFGRLFLWNLSTKLR